MDNYHYPFLDWLRIIACFLVIVLHVAAIQFPTFSDIWFITMSWDSVSRMCVPLFFMISGFLLLDKQIESIARFYIKRFLRIFIPFFIICIIYFFTPDYRTYSITQYLIKIITEYPDYHLWYIYVLVPLYLAWPFFVKIFNGTEGSKYAWLYILIWFNIFIVGITVVRYFYPEVRNNDNYIIFHLNFSFFYSYIGYALCGILIKWHCAKFSKSFYTGNLLIYLMANLAIIYHTWHYSRLMGKPEQLFFENFTPFVFCQAVSFFILCTSIKRESAWLRSLADKTFWIYLLHLLWLRLFLGLWPLPNNCSGIVAIPAMATAVFIMAWLTSIPLRTLELRLLRFLCQ